MAEQIPFSESDDKLFEQAWREVSIRRGTWKTPVVPDESQRQVILLRMNLRRTLRITDDRKVNFQSGVVSNQYASIGESLAEPFGETFTRLAFEGNESVANIPGTSFSGSQRIGSVWDTPSVLVRLPG